MHPDTEKTLAGNLRNLMRRVSGALHPDYVPAAPAAAPADLLSLSHAASLISMEADHLLRLANHPTHRYPPPVAGRAEDGLPLFDPLSIVRWAIERASASGYNRAKHEVTQ